MLTYAPVLITDNLVFLLNKNSEEVHRHLLLASDYFEKKFLCQDIRYDLRGKTAGQLVYKRNRFKNDSYMRFNLELLEKYQDTFIQQVVPHECAHLVAFSMYGRKIRPHGTEWRFVMEEVFGVNASVYHSFETTTARNMKYFSYACGCESIEHKLSAIRHNRVLKGAQYRCKKCSATLSLLA